MYPYDELIYSYNEFMNDAHGSKSKTFYQSKSKTIRFTNLLMQQFVKHMHCPPDCVAFKYAPIRDEKPNVQCDLTVALKDDHIPDTVYLCLTLDIRPNDEDDTGGYLIYVGNVSAIIRDIESTDPDVSYDTVETCQFLVKLLASQLHSLFPKQ